MGGKRSTKGLVYIYVLSMGTDGVVKAWGLEGINGGKMEHR